MQLFPTETYLSNYAGQTVPESEQRSAGDLGNLGEPSAEFVRLFGGRATTSGVRVNENTCMGISSVWACIRNLAEDVAGSMFDVYERQGNRGRRRVIDHPMFHLLNTESNPEMSPFEFRQAVTANAVLWGQGYAEIERAGDGTPLALWPIQSWRIVTRRDADNQLYYQTDALQGDGTYRIDPWNMLRIGGFSNNGLVGFWLAREAQESWGLGMAAERTLASYFGNNAMMGGVLESPTKLGPKAKKALREGIEEQHQGPERAFRLMLLDGGLKFTPGSVNMQEAQASELRQFQVEEVARWFRMPVHLIQSMARSTFNNIEHQSIEYCNFTLRSWFKKWEQEAKRKLCRRSEVNLYGIHEYSDLLRGDQVSQATAEAKLVLGCVKTPNESRSKFNLDPVEGGDILLAPLNTTTLRGLNAGAAQLHAEAVVSANDAGIDPDDLLNPDDVPGGIVDQADAAPIQMSPLRPPPQGVVPPGQQPGMDSTFTGFRSLLSIAKAQSPLLVDAVRRLLHTEADKVTRASRRPEFEQWSEKFYRSHLTHVRDALSGPVLAMVESAAAVEGKPLSPGLRAKVQAHVDGMTTRYVAASRSDLSDVQDLPHRVLWWEENRAAPFVAAEVEALTELLREG